MITIDWLLQAGFKITGGGTSVAIDPYLSNACDEIYGLKRRRSSPLTAAQLSADVVCVSHWHEDHLDLPTLLTVLMTESTVVAPPSCLARIEGKGVAPGRLIPLTAGEQVQVGDAVISAVPARHQVPGYLTEDAIGFVVELEGVRVYHSGDTEYDRTLLSAGVDSLDVALVCTNGTGGNMNTIEAAALTAQLRPRLAVPMHFGLWSDDGYGPGATLDPEHFVELCATLAPETTVVIPSPETPLKVLASRDE